MKLHNALTNSPTSLHFACAGAGVEFIRRLWRTPGSSSYLTGTSLLQAYQEIDTYIGYTPTAGYCSREVAADLAIAAFRHAARASGLGPEARRPIGLALSAAVASDRIPRGEQRAHLCVISECACFQRHFRLEKAHGEAARRRHDRRLADVLENLILRLLEGGVGELAALAPALMERPCFLPDGRRLPAPTEGGLLFPANFNPVHEGHWETCEAAECMLRQQAELNLEANPPNKEAIPVPELLRRIARVQAEAARGISGGRALTVTSGQATFLDKARARPGSAFIVGSDAVIRFLDPVWGYDVRGMLAELRALGTHFYVRARRIGTVITALDQIEIPCGFAGMFHRLDGHSEISSSQVRAREQFRAS